MYKGDNRNIKEINVTKKKGVEKMARSDELDFDRIQGLLEGFGWKVKRTEIKPLTLEMEVEKDRVEPDTDICSQPT